MPPHLETTRLVLDGFRSTDIDAVFAYASNPRVAETVSWTAHATREDSAAFVDFAQRTDGADADTRFVCWAIRQKEEGVAIGSISFHRSNDEGRIDYALAESAWGRGIVTEAARAVLSWAFATIPALALVRSGGLSANRASLRVMEKCGMRFERTYRVRLSKFGNEVREVTEYVVSREEFAAFKA